jgi:hypothetical protein
VVARQNRTHHPPRDLQRADGEQLLQVVGVHLVDLVRDESCVYVCVRVSG